MLRYEIEENGYAAAIQRLKTKFAAYVPPSNTKNPPLGVPALAITYPPTIFPKFLPLLATFEISPQWDNRRRGIRGSSISALRIAVVIYALAIKGKDSPWTYEDGEETARNLALEVWSRWVSAFEADEEMGGYDITLHTDLGEDRGGGYVQPRNAPDTWLWSRASILEIAT